MKYLFLVFLFLTGCEEYVDNRAYITVTCYDDKGSVTVRHPHVKGPITMINDHSLGYWSQKCVLERENESNEKGR